MSPQKRRGQAGAKRSSAAKRDADAVDPAGSVESGDSVEPNDLAESPDAPESDDMLTGAEDASVAAQDAASETDSSDGAVSADAPVATPARPASAAAAAAARARRIGGRPTSARRPETDEEQPSSSDPAVSSVASTSSVSITKGTTESDKTPDTSGEPDEPAKKVRVKRPDWSRRGKKSVEVDASSAATVAAGEGKVSPGGRSTVMRWAPAVVLIVAAIVLAAVLAVSTHGKRWDKPSANAERDQVLAAAKMCIANTNSYTYKNIDSFAKKGSACATGKFGQQFTKTVDDLIRKNAPTSKQIQSLQVNSAGIMNVTDDNEWDVLVYGQLKVSNTATPKGEIDPFASVARLTDVGGKWRISNLCTAQFNGPINACY